MRGTLPLIVLLVLLAPAAAAAPAGEVFSTAVANPVDLAFGADGRLYAADLASGEIHLLLPDGSSTVVARVPASAGGNGGFTGLTVDVSDPAVLYTHYSMLKEGAPNGKVQRITRVAHGVETVLLDDLPWAEMHDGGRIAMGADGVLYATTGDNDHRSPSQDEASVLGKILRFHRDGTPTAGNPAGWHALAIAKGFRNPFGIVVTAQGEVYVSDNGGTEEVNRILPGANYGWPMCSGPCGHHAGVTDPVAHWGPEHFGPTGIDVRGRTLYLGDFVYGQVRTVNLDTGETGIFWKLGQVLDVAVGPDDCLYVSTWKAIHRAPLGDLPCAIFDPRDPGTQKGDEVAPPEEFQIPHPAALGALTALGLAALRRRPQR